MDLDELILHLQKLQSEGKGKYKVLAHDVQLNTANDRGYIIDEKVPLYNVEVDDVEKSIQFGDYYEYYAY